MKKIQQLLPFLFCLLFACAQKSKLEIVFEDDTYQFTGVSVSKTGRIFVNYPYWSDQHRYSLVEVLPDKTAVPYPNEAMNEWNFNLKGNDKWICVQATYVDENDVLWVVDPASPYLAKVFKKSYKLVAFDLKDNKMIAYYDFQAKIEDDGYINDVRIDNKNRFAYLTNSNTGGLIVVNLESGETKEVLKQHKSTTANENYAFKPGKGKIWSDTQGKAVRIHSDGLTLSKDGQFLYYKSLTDDDLYQITTAALRDFSLSDAELENYITYLGHISTADGLITDPEGNIYMGDLENNRIVIYNPNTQVKSILVEDERLQWADSFAIYNGFLYVACSQIHHLPQFNGGKSTRNLPYQIVRVALPPTKA